MGVAIIGSVFSSLYVGSLDEAGGVFASLPPEAQEATDVVVRFFLEHLAAAKGDA